MIYAAWLPAASHKKPHEDGAVQHDAGMRLLEYGLLKQYGIMLKTCRLIKNKWGKPFLKDYPDIFFNISHCNGLAVCVFGTASVGIDAECGRKCGESVIKRVLSAEEYDCLCRECGSDESGRNLEFIRYWTLKESYGKAVGSGMGYDWKAVTFSRNGQDKAMAKECGTEEVRPWNCSDTEYSAWQTKLCKDSGTYVISVVRKQKEAFREAIEWCIF